MKTLKQFILSSTPFVFRLILCIILGMVTLTAVYSLSTDIIEQNASSAYELFDNESTHPSVSTESVGVLDNYSDAIMLLEASNVKNDTPLHEAMESSFYQIQESDSMPLNDPNDDYVKHYKNNQEFRGEVHYSRYWHGYLVFLKPLLMLTDYSGVRLINGLLQVTLTCVVAFYVFKKLGIAPMFAFLLIILSLRPFVSYLGLQYSGCYYVFLFACLALLCLKDIQSQKAYYVFLYSGIAVAFFDLLSYPLITFGIPAVFYLYLRKNKGVRDGLSSVIKSGCAWIFGYAGMWVAKWSIGSLVLHRNLIRDGLNSVLIRTNNSVFSTKDSVFANVTEFSKTVYFPLLIAFIVFFLLLSILRLITCNRKTLLIKIIKSVACIAAPYLLVAASPIVWYVVLVNHSCVHFYLFANKIFSIFMFSMMLLVVEVYKVVRNNTVSKKGLKKAAQAMVVIFDLPQNFFGLFVRE